MAASASTRLGIYTWTAGTDSFTRSQMTDSMSALEAKAAGFDQTGTRPTAGVGYKGFFHYSSTDSSVGALSYCNGTAWFDIGTFGSSTPATLTGSTGAVGTDATYSRSDHRHPIGALSVDTAELAAGAVTDAKVTAVSASKITGGTLNASNFTVSGLAAGDIPALSAAKITSDAFGVDRIPSLSAAKITSGAFHVDRIPVLALGTKTSGNYVETVAAGAGLAVSGVDSEGSTKTVAHNTSGGDDVSASGNNAVNALTIDANGHVTATGKKDLDTVYYLKTEVNAQLGGTPTSDTTDRLMYGYSSVSARNGNASKCIWITNQSPSSPEVGDIWIDLN